MKKHFLKFLVTQSKLIAICATGFILFSCGNSQSGKMGDDEFAVATVNETSSQVIKLSLIQQPLKERKTSKFVRRYQALS